MPFGKYYRGVPERMPQSHLPSTSMLDTTELRVSRARLDTPDPQMQNYEVQLKVVPARNDRPEGVYAAWMTGRQQPDRSTLTRLALAYSANGGRNFQPIPSPFSDIPGTIHFDPTLEYDPATDSVLVSKLLMNADYKANLWMAKTLPGSPDRIGAGRVVEQPPHLSLDKGWLAAGTDTQGQAVIYHTDVRGVRASRDGGETWTDPRTLNKVYNLLQPLVLADGRLFISYFGRADDDTAQALFVAGDSEASNSLYFPASLHDFAGSLREITESAVAGGFRTAPAAVVAQSPIDGRLFAVLHDVTARREGAPRDLDVDVLLRVSNDGGRTWGAARNLSAGLEPYSDQFMPWLDIDAAGGLHLIYFETSTGPQADERESVDVHLWYARSLDAGASWQRTRLTPEPIPSQLTRWAPYGDVNNPQFLGDYISLVSGSDAVFAGHPVYENGTLGMAVSRIELSTAPSVSPSNPLALAGLWYEPATSGQGFQIDWIEGDVLTVVFFGHRDSGQNLFLTGIHSGRPSFGETLSIPLQQVGGGRFNGLSPEAIQRSAWGTLELRFDSCGAATARLSGVDGEQSLSLQRIGRPPGIACP